VLIDTNFINFSIQRSSTNLASSDYEFFLVNRISTESTIDMFNSDCFDSEGFHSKDCGSESDSYTDSGIDNGGGIDGLGTGDDSGISCDDQVQIRPLEESSFHDQPHHRLPGVEARHPFQDHTVGFS